MKTEINLKLVLLVICAGIILILAGCSNQTGINKISSGSTNGKNLYPIDEITHAHGLAVDVENSSKLYIATHHGLMVLLNDKELYALGKSQDDYMGFTTHPTNSNILFSSGHPVAGGNIGFQVSNDGGFNWKKISEGIDGPVDFHAMAVSASNPKIVYGYYQGNLQRSDDGGKTWKIANSGLPQVVSIVAHPKNEDVVYAATIQGLMVSKNKGASWDYLSDDLKGFITLSGFAINQQNPNEMISYSGKLKMAKSNDGGANWQSINEKFNDETPLYIAYDRQNQKNVYTITEKQKIYKSDDEGNTWKIVF